MAALLTTRKFLVAAPNTIHEATRKGGTCIMTGIAKAEFTGILTITRLNKSQATDQAFLKQADDDEIYGAVRSR